MNARSILRCMAAASASVIAAVASAEGSDSDTASPARRMLDRAFFNLYADDYIQEMRLTTTSRGRRGITRSLQVIRKQSSSPGKALVRFTDPPDLRRTSLLIVENENEGGSDDLFVYLPAARITRRLTSAQRADSFFGTDLSYEDVEPKSAADYEVRGLGTSGLGSASACEQIELRPRASTGSSYDRIVACVEESRGIILWMDFYVASTRIKRLDVDLESVRRVGERFLPYSMSMTDLRRGSSTAVDTVSYEALRDISDELFTTWNLEVGSPRKDRARASSED